jgi:YidC/Oxa1 family membrane protein insertase
MSMEVRMLLAIVLSFSIFLLYHVLFVKEPPAPVDQKEAVQETQEAEGQSVTALEDVQPLDEPPIEEPLPEEVVAQAPATEARTITVSTPLYVAQFSENGGTLKSFKLKKYKESLNPGSPLKELVQLPEDPTGTLVVSFMGQQVVGLRNALFDAGLEGDSVDITEGQERVSFVWRSSGGVTIQKTYAFSADTYEVGLEIKVGNLSSEPINDNLAISLRNTLGEDAASRYVFSGPAAFIDGELEEIKVDEIEDQDQYTGHIAWVAQVDRYFLSAIIPKESSEAALKLAKPADILRTIYVDPSGPIPPRAERTYQYKVYFGPKTLKTLNSVGADLARVVDFGFFDIIAKPLLHAMNFIFRFIPNYGVVIIIITIIVKILFWPLSNKSYESMSQMKKLQPKMAEIKAKYKHDKKQMNQEMMNLYKLYKVNPLGGCLPMVLQIPVFFAFYKMLYQAIELRHAPFWLWINDLSAPDRLFNFDIAVPLMAPPYGIPVLTLIMGASMFLQQKMSPPPGDPTQAKMMMFMPIFFTFIFINFPSGLVLYWLVNNILSMVQQKYVSKRTA